MFSPYIWAKAPSCQTFLYLSEASKLKISFENLKKSPKDANLLQTTLSLAEMVLRKHKVDFERVEDELRIRPTTKTRLNRFALKTLQKTGAVTVFDPLELIDLKAVALAGQDYETLAPLSLELSLKAILTGHITDSEVHEQTHIRNFHKAFSPDRRKSLAHGGFSTGNVTQLLDEIQAYFSEIKFLRSKREKEEIDDIDLLEKIDRSHESLHRQILTSQRAWMSAKRFLTGLLISS